MLFDAHTHLNYEEYSNEERKKLAEEIDASQMGYIIDAGDSVESSKQAVIDSETYEWCYCAVGIHPEHAASATDEMIKEIEKLASNGKAVSIGEIGLDFHYGKEEKEEQITLFRKQIRLANRLKMPLTIHSRDASQLTMDILKEEGAFSRERKSWFPKRLDENLRPTDDARVQIHCYSGSLEMALQYIELGATISVGGPVTFKNGHKTAEVVAAVPLEFLLSETDAPFLTPVPMRGKPNKPQYVEYIVRKIAEIKDIPIEEAEKKLFNNGKVFFSITN